MLLKRMVALYHANNGTSSEVARDRLRAQARAMGMRVVSLNVTEDPLPDAALEALPAVDIGRIAAISRDMYDKPQKHVAELERLSAKYPHIPMLRNHLAVSLEAAGQRDRAAEIIADTARRFPSYVFAFCNHVLALVHRGELREARALVETGPRGPLFTLVDFDPTRDTFHVSEAISHAAMVGHYMLATGRREAAKVQLKLLKKSAPRSPQYRSLARALRRPHDTPGQIAAALRVIAEQARRRTDRVNAPRKSSAKRKPNRESTSRSATTDPTIGLFEQPPGTS